MEILSHCELIDSAHEREEIGIEAVECQTGYNRIVFCGI